MCQKLELMEQNLLFKTGFKIFLKAAPFWDFIDAGLSNFMTSGIQIRFPLVIIKQSTVIVFKTCNLL